MSAASLLILRRELGSYTRSVYPSSQSNPIPVTGTRRSPADFM
jgi:hypothetical protein